MINLMSKVANYGLIILTTSAFLLLPFYLPLQTVEIEELNMRQTYFSMLPRSAFRYELHK